VRRPRLAPRIEIKDEGYALEKCEKMILRAERRYEESYVRRFFLGRRQFWVAQREFALGRKG